MVVTRNLRLVLWLLLAASLALSLTLIRVDPDVTRFISTGHPRAVLRLAAAIQQGPAGRLVLIGVQSDNARNATDTSRRWVGELRKSGLFSSVHNGDTGPLMAEADAIVPFRYQLSQRIDAASFSEARLRASLAQAHAMLGDSRAWLVERLLPRDPTLETLQLVTQWSSGASLPLRHGVWFSRSGDRALIFATTRAAGDDAAAQSLVETTLRQLVTESRRRDASTRIEFTGLGLLAAEAQRETRARVERLAAISSVLVALILAASYRRARPVVLSLAPVLLGVAAGCVVTHVVFGDINLLALAFAGILVDEGSDYASYLLTQSRLGEPIGDEAKRVWPTLRLAVLTSTAAFAVLLLGQFRGLQQLGLLCGVGLLVAGVAARWLVPDLLDPQRRVTWSPPVAVGRMTGAARRPLSARGPLLVNGMAMAAGLIVMLAARPLWNDDVGAINPLPPDRVAVDRTLRDAAGLPLDQSVLLFAGPDVESVLQAQEAWMPSLARLRERGAVDRVEMAALYLPSRRAQAERLAAIPEGAVLRSRLARAADGTPFNVDAFEPFLADAAQARATTLTLESLPEGLFRQRVEGLLPSVDGRRVGLVPIAGPAARDELLSSARHAVLASAVEVAWFDTRAELTELLASVRQRLVALLAVCALVVCAVVQVDLRSVARNGRVMLPVLTGIVLTAAVVRAAFGPLTLFNVVALMLTLGVLTNYSLFIHAPPRSTDADQSRVHTIFSLIVASSTTLAVFGALALSGIAVVESVGLTVVVGIIIGLGWLVATRGDRFTVAEARQDNP